MNAPEYYVIPKLSVWLYTVYVFEVLYVMMLLEYSGKLLGSCYKVGRRGVECGSTSSVFFCVTRLPEPVNSCDLHIVTCRFKTDRVTAKKFITEELMRSGA